MRTNGERSLSVTALLAEVTSSELTSSDGTASALLTSRIGEELLLVRDCNGCSSERASRPPDEWTGDAVASSKLIRERAGEKAIRSGAGGDAEACMPAAVRST